MTAAHQLIARVAPISLLTLLGMGGLLLLASFFALSETACFSLGPVDRRRLTVGDGRRARALRACFAHPQSMLITILMCNLAVSVLYFALAAELAVALRPVSVTLEVVVGLGALVVLIVIGEVVPKVIAISHAPAIIGVVAPALVALRVVLTPARFFLERLIAWLMRAARRDHAGTGHDHGPALSREEIKEFLELRHDRAMLDEGAAALIREVISLSDIRVREIMTPRVDVAALRVDTELGEVRAWLRRRRLPWVVLHEGDLDHVVGVIEARDAFLRGDRLPVRALAVPLPVVPEVARLDSLVRSFRESGTTRALVVDEYGGAAGLVTLEQAVAEILGDFDAATADEALVEVRDGAWRVDGSLPIREWNELFGGRVEPERFETIGGYVVAGLDRIPREGDVLRDQRFAFRVVKVRRRRVRLLEVEAVAP